MRIAFFSPMPPAKSGIADYSAALVESLSRIATVTIHQHRAAPDGDIALYQIGNNGYHAFAYEQALADPGVVVVHEANLHHLIAEMTIKRGDWDAYMREVEYDGGPDALAYAQRVRRLEVGPDYDGVRMLRRLLQASRGVVVHSHYVDRAVRDAGFTGPCAVIPHGAWIPDADRMGFRHRLGIDDPAMPLIGIFGFLKPYKRIAESLRAFKRLLHIEPRAKLVLVGEPHPELPLQSMVTSLGIGPSVRVLGFTPIDEFPGYIAASDVVLNLRYPTVGESSGTLLRSLGLGRAVLVSDIGSFSEYPDDICLKVPVGRGEEDAIFEYMNLLVSRPDVRESMGKRAREWVARECSWDHVANKYLAFLGAVAGGQDWIEPEPAQQAAGPERASAPVEPEYLVTWASNAGAEGYIRTHIDRLEHTLRITPAGSPEKRILEMGAYMQITPALRTRLGYGEVRGCYYGPAGQVDHKEIVSSEGEVFICDLDLFDAECDPFPYGDDYFDTVLCCELIEHLPTDPMHMMAEVNRILKPGGHFVLTTPNICSMRAIAAILQGYHPGFFPAYLKPGDDAGARHAREYAPREIVYLFRDSGFELTLLDTGEFRDEPHPEHEWVRHLLTLYKLERDLRGDGLYAVGVKRGAIRQRYPSWLYS